jgi:molybdenum cofactor synthesis domain-containing protein
MTASDPIAALLIIGNEILSGRTQDANLNFIAKALGAVGVPLKETRVVPDIEAEIISALNALRKRYTYVFTTGGIGSTHDDITVDAVAAAFDIPVVEHPEAKALLAAHFGKKKMTSARLRMARVPEGATLIDNPASAVPGIKIDNVFMLAGVPEIMQSMMSSVVAGLCHGPTMVSMTVSGYVPESDIADELRALAARFSNVDIGSYPWMREERFGTALVARDTDPKSIKKAADQLLALMKKYDPKSTLSGA